MMESEDIASFYWSILGSWIYFEFFKIGMAENIEKTGGDTSFFDENKYLLGTSFARPLISKVLVEVAHKEGATYICHGCTGKGNDQVRFETGVFSLDPTLKILAPWRMWDISSREDAIDYAQKNDIKITVTKEKINHSNRL